MKLLRRILWKIRLTLKPEVVPFFTRDAFKYEIENHEWRIGKFTYGVPIIIPSDTSKLHIGKYCSIASPTTIILGNHNYKHVSTFPFHNISEDGPIFPKPFPDPHQASNGDVLIGNDVWIGRDVTITSGVSIGDGAVLAASAVVTHDVPPYAVVAGCPAVVIKYRFSPEQIKDLLRICWWNFPDEFVQGQKHLFQLEPSEFIHLIDSLNHTDNHF